MAAARKPAGLPGVGLIALLISGAALGAEPPVAMVMTVSGVTTPPVEAMDELPGGTSLRLGPDARLSFLHYQRCKLVTITGGTLRLSPADYRADGRVESEQNGPCPRTYSLTSDATGARTTGALVMRNLERVPHWPADPEFVLTGAAAGRVGGGAIYAGDRPDQPVAHLDLAGKRAKLPPGSTGLIPEGTYKLRLTIAGRPEPADIDFVATAPTGRSALVILRVD